MLKQEQFTKSTGPDEENFPTKQVDLIILINSLNSIAAELDLLSSNIGLKLAKIKQFSTKTNKLDHCDGEPSTPLSFVEEMSRALDKLIVIENRFRLYYDHLDELV